MGFCTACGRPALGTDRFCAHCGQGLLAYDRPAISPEKHVAPLTQVRPWVRYWARTLDACLFAFIFGAVIGVISAIYPDTFNPWPDALWGIVLLFLWVFVEPFFLCWFGATPGKWLLRIAVRTADGGKLSFEQALQRSASVWWRGMAAGLPLFNIATAIYGYKRLINNGETSWDADGKFRVSHSRVGVFRAIVSGALTMAITVILLVNGSDNIWRTAFTEGGGVHIQGANSAPSSPQPTASQVLSAGPSNTVSAGPVVLDGVQTSPTDIENETARWNSDVQNLFKEHPVLNYGGNAAILQEKLYEVAKPGMSNQDMLQQAYYATTTDRRWSQTP